MIDSHAHLNDPRFADDLDEVIARAKEGGVERIINVGYDYPSSRQAVTLAHQYSGFYGVVGLHPHDANQLTDKLIADIRSLAADSKVVAIGEMGLDYYYDNSPRKEQQEAFRRQLQLAKELGLPAVIHSRDAAQDTLQVLAEYPDVRCVLHCFSQSKEMAHRYLELGHYLSFAGAITFKNAHKLREVVSDVPLDRVLVETDCPYLTPVPYRGKRNEPAYVANVAEMVASIHSKSLAEIADKTAANTREFFGIKD